MCGIFCAWQIINLIFKKRLEENRCNSNYQNVKWIRKEITKSLFVRPSTLGLFDDGAHTKLDELIIYLQQQGIKIEEPKCNFDVEMA